MNLASIHVFTQYTHVRLLATFTIQSHICDIAYSDLQMDGKSCAKMEKKGLGLFRIDG